MTITVTIPALSRTSPTFKTDLDTFFSETFPAFASQANALATDVSVRQADVTARQTDVAEKQGIASAAATTATAQAAIASAAAVSAVNAPGTAANSTDTLTVGVGTKTFSIQPGKAFVVGQFVTVSASGGDYMMGRISAHDTATGAISVEVMNAHGSATASAWVVAVAAVAPSGVPAGTLVSDATVAMKGGAHYILTSSSAVAATLPTNPSPDDWIWITVENNRADNTLDLNGKTLSGSVSTLSGVVTLNVRNHATIALRYINDILQWRLV